MIGAAQLARMKPGAKVINASRGKVVDIDALAAALALQAHRRRGPGCFPQGTKGRGRPLRFAHA